MPHEITVPRLGWSMEQGTFLGWLKKEGDFVRAGEPLFELEGEKAAQEIESVDSGTLRIGANGPPPGATVNVGAVLGHLLVEGESAVSAEAPATSAPARPSPPAAPSVRRKARELGVDLETVAGSGRSGRIVASDLKSPAPVARVATSTTLERAIATPRARRIATELGVDWKNLSGTGNGGRIRERDVRAAATSKPSPALSARRQTIAHRLRTSQERTVPVTLTSQADATNLVNLRNQFKATGQAVTPSYTDLIAKLVAAALKQHPRLADGWRNDRLVAAEGMHLGIAVDTDDGLLVPVICDVDTLSLADFTRRARELIERARAGTLPVADMQGGVFTITSLGAFGIDAFTPVINYPETAILGLGAIRRTPVFIDTQCVPRDLITLSLTFDHAALDGAPAARFLQAVCEAIENPSAWLLLGS
jgi:pyruvate dehydrogenase E2 component (dihydrolipoamide acetyltransferase)